MTTDVVKAGIQDSVYTSVRRLLSRDVGCIVVVDDDHVVGIITKGDVLKKAFLKQLDPKEISAKKIMTHPVLTIDPSSSLEEASHLMSEKHVTKLPVVKDGKLVGIITSTDIINAEPVQVRYLQELVRARFVPHDLR